jgi:hypothetical protein
MWQFTDIRFQSLTVIQLLQLIYSQANRNTWQALTFQSEEVKMYVHNSAIFYNFSDIRNGKLDENLLYMQKCSDWKELKFCTWAHMTTSSNPAYTPTPQTHTQFSHCIALCHHILAESYYNPILQNQ